MPYYYKTIVLPLLFFTSTALGQVNNYELGIIGGPNWLTLKGNEVAVKNYSKPSTAYSTGLSFQYNFKKIFSIHTDVLFEKKQNIANIPSGTSGLVYFNETDRKTEMDYLTIPVLLKTSFGRKRFLFIYTGIYIGAIIKDEVRHYIAGTGYFTHDLVGNDNKTDFGATIGAGMHIPLNKKFAITLEARNNWGITNIRKDIGKEVLKLNTANILLGIHYNFERKKNSDSTHQKEKKVFVKPFYSSQLSYRRELNNTTKFYLFNNGSSNKTYSYAANEETSIHGNEWGLLIELKLFPNVNINTGLTFDTQGFKTKGRVDSLNIGTWGDMTGSYDYTVYDQPQMILNFKFISLPLILNYELKRNRASYFIGIGSEIKYLYSNSLKISGIEVYRNKYNSEENRYSKNSRFTHFCIVNLGASLPITKSMFFIIEPYLKYEMAKLTTYPQDLAIQLWSTGCRVGIKF